METTNKIATAFIKAKKAFAPAIKCATNPHFKSKYADLAACLEAVDDALLNNGIAVFQETCEDASGVTVETVFLHESGESIRCGKLHVPAAKQDPQGYGSALTYARRYSLMTACGIAPEDDDGNAASAPQKPAGLSDSRFDDSLTAITEAANLDSLKTVFSAAFKEASTAQKKVLEKAKDSRKAQLMGEQA